MNIKMLNEEQFELYKSGKDFIMNEDIAQYFEDRGLKNMMGYPLEYFKIKLKDNWIRDNMYSKKLWKEDSMYALKKLDDCIIGETVLSKYLGKDIFIAGGYALGLHLPLYKANDIDVFFVCSEERAIEIIDEIVPKKRHRSGNSISCWLQIGDKYKNFQFILRLYKCPSEIVHGFDLDSCGILYNGTSLYCTERTEYSIKNMTNWFDPERASQSYIYRLLKYQLKGFRIKLNVSDDTFPISCEVHNHVLREIGNLSEGCPALKHEVFMTVYHKSLDNIVKKIIQRFMGEYIDSIEDELKEYDGTNLYVTMNAIQKVNREYYEKNVQYSYNSSISTCIKVKKTF
ncbi:hypothetical protein D3C87_762460 [compost metagenome]